MRHARLVLFLKSTFAKADRSHLVPKKIRDKNGIVRTYYVNPRLDAQTQALFGVAPTVTLDGRATKVEQQMFHRALGTDEWGQLVGGITGATVLVAGHIAQGRIPASLQVRVRHRFYKGETERVLYLEGDGTMTLDNEFIAKSQQAPLEHFGARVVGTQLLTAKRLGFWRAQCFASGHFGGRHNGYYTWAVLGFDGPLMDAYQDLRLRAAHDLTLLREPKTVQEILGAPGGRNWWKRHGRAIELQFVLDDHSPQWEIMLDYLQEKGIWRPPT